MRYLSAAHRRAIALWTAGVLALARPVAMAQPHPTASHAVAEESFPGRIYGTLLWTGDKDPLFRARFCEGTHSDRFGGLADVVVVAEPLDAAAKHALLAARSTSAGQDGDSELDWYDDRIVVGKAAPHSELKIRNLADGPRTLRVLDGAKVLRELVIASMGDAAVAGLPEGVLRVTATERPSSEGWLYVTPWPSKVTGGNCRWSFQVPPGRYRVHGWHPYGGERSVPYTALRTDTPERCSLNFDALRNGSSAPAGTTHRTP